LIASLELVLCHAGHSLERRAGGRTGRLVAEVAGRGTGLTDERLAHKVEVIKRALEVDRPDPKQPLAVLAKVGGFEIGGLAGTMLGATAHRIPVVIDGFISGAATLIATALPPGY
jgi:nicotinate-nucleotide--dimethylbenzimidazole phosphoribosyltransferase